VLPPDFLMRIGLVVDASCDLPDALFAAHGIRILPSILQLDGKSWLDDRTPEQTMMLYRRFISDRAVDARSGACSAEEIREIFLHELVLDYERVLVISACAEYSDMFHRATDASYAILQDYRERREAGERAGSFALRVLDSRTVCAGEAIMVCRALQLLAEGTLGFEKMRRILRDEAGQITCLLVPGDPWYLRRRGLTGKGAGLSRSDYALACISDRKPVLELTDGRRQVIARPRGFLAACSAALARAADGVARGLGVPALALSFGGDPRVIRGMPAYQELEAQAATARIDMYLSVMSATMGTRAGPGALSVAWLNQRQARTSAGG
jgi:fatty acid-binding protein DegV